MVLLQNLFLAFMNPRQDDSMRRVYTSVVSIQNTLHGKMRRIPLNSNELHTFTIYTISSDFMKTKSTYSKLTPDEWKSSCFISGENMVINRFLLENKAGILVLCPCTISTTITDEVSDEHIKLNDEDTDQFKFEMDYEGPTAVIVAGVSSTVATMLVKQSTPVSEYATRDDKYHVSNTTTLEDIKQRITLHNISAVAVVNSLGEVQGIVTQNDLLKEKLIQVTMVGCSNVEDSIRGITSDGVYIGGIIDNKKMRQFASETPIDITLKPCHSVCSIIADKFCERGVLPSVGMAGVMLSGILSATQNLKQATVFDHRMALQMSAICGCDVEVLGEELFVTKDINFE